MGACADPIVVIGAPNGAYSGMVHGDLVGCLRDRELPTYPAVWGALAPAWAEHSGTACVDARYPGALRRQWLGRDARRIGTCRAGSSRVRPMFGVAESDHEPVTDSGDPHVPAQCVESLLQIVG